MAAESTAYERLLIEVKVLDSSSAPIAALLTKLEQFGAKSARVISDPARKGAADFDGSMSRMGGSVDRFVAGMLGRLGPAGRALSDFARTAGLGRTIGSVGSGGVQALAGVGVAGAAFGSAALAAATAAGVLASQSIALDQALVGVTQRLALSAGQADEMRARIRALAIETGRSAVEIGSGLSSAFREGARSLEEAFAAVEVAHGSVLLGLAETPDKALSSLDAIIDAYGRKPEELRQIRDELFAAANFGEAPFGNFVASVAQLGPLAERLGIPLQDVAAQLSLITRQGVPAQQAGSGLALVLAKLANPTDEAHKSLSALNVDLSRTAFATRGLTGVFADINQKVGDNTELLVDLFSSHRLASAALKGISDAGIETANAFDAISRSAAESSAALERLENTPGERLSRRVSAISGVFGGLGDKIAEGAADLVGVTKFQDPTLAGSTLGKQFADSIAEALRAGDIEQALEEALSLKRATENARSAFRELFGKPVEDVTEEDRQRIAKITPAVTGGRDLAQLLDLATTDLFKALDAAKLGTPSVVRRNLEGAEQRFEGFKPDRFGEPQPVFVPVDVVPPTPSAMTRKIDEALALVDPSAVPIDFAFDLTAIQKAQETVLRLRLKPENALASKEKVELTDAVDLLQRFGTKKKEATDLSNELSSRATSGTRRERAELDALVRSTEQRVVVLGKLAGADPALREALGVDAISSAVEKLRTAETARLDAADNKALLASRAQELAQVQAVTEAQAKLARLRGDFPTADRLDRGAADAKVSALAAAARAQAAAAREAALADDGTADSIERANASRERAAELQGEVLVATQAVTEAEQRSGASRQRLAAQSEILRGLDREIARIAQSADLRRVAIEADLRGGKLRAEDARDLLLIEAERFDAMEKLARLEAQRSRRDDLLQLAQSVARSSQDVLGLESAILDVERQRLREKLEITGATEAELVAFARLQDLKGRQRTTDLALADVAVSPEALGEFDLLQAALEETNRRLREGRLAASEYEDALRSAFLSARTGAEAAARGTVAGLESIRRHLADDFSRSLEAATTQWQAFEQGGVSAFRAIVGQGRDAGEVLKELAKEQLLVFAEERFVKPAIAKLGQSIFGAPKVPDQGVSAQRVGESGALDLASAGLKPAVDALVSSAATVETAGSTLSAAADKLSNALAVPADRLTLAADTLLRAASAFFGVPQDVARPPTLEPGFAAPPAESQAGFIGPPTPEQFGPPAPSTLSEDGNPELPARAPLAQPRFEGIGIDAVLRAALVVPGQTLQLAGDRLLVAASALGAPGQSSLAAGASAPFVAPVSGVDRFDQETLAPQQGQGEPGSAPATADATAAGQAFSGAVQAGAVGFTSTVLSGGQGLAGLLQGVGQSLFGSLSSFLAGGVTSFLGLPFKLGGVVAGQISPRRMAQGGVVGGHSYPSVPREHVYPFERAEGGGLYERTTYLQVAEVPGLKELVAPLQPDGTLKATPKDGGYVVRVPSGAEVPLKLPPMADAGARGGLAPINRTLATLGQSGQRDLNRGTVDPVLRGAPAGEQRRGLKDLRIELQAPRGAQLGGAGRGLGRDLAPPSRARAAPGKPDQDMVLFQRSMGARFDEPYATGGGARPSERRTEPSSFEPAARAAPSFHVTVHTAPVTVNLTAGQGGNPREFARQIGDQIGEMAVKAVIDGLKKTQELRDAVRTLR